jgi:hypothetical protein
MTLLPGGFVVVEGKRTRKKCGKTVGGGLHQKSLHLNNRFLPRFSTKNST